MTHLKGKMKYLGRGRERGIKAKKSEGDEGKEKAVFLTFYVACNRNFLGLFFRFSVFWFCRNTLVS